jgi:pimeloyl-ACP methyl ester carboxylesterase
MAIRNLPVCPPEFPFSIRWQQHLLTSAPFAGSISFGTLLTAFVMCILLLAGCVASPPTGPGMVITEDFMIPAADPGIQLHIRNKRLAGQDRFPPERIVLFVHGTTYPGIVFDVNLPGGSWMDFAAQRGFDTYYVDLRGYGGSTRPPAMNRPPSENPPFADTKEEIQDVLAAVDFILKRRAVPRLDLVGWSSGTLVAGGYTAENNEKVNRLVLYGPVWTYKFPPPLRVIGSYRTVQRDAARARNLRGIPKEREEEISPTAWFDRWWAMNVSTDPEGAKQYPPVLRAPNGMLKDIDEYWGKGQATWDPAKIKVPTLLIGAEWDNDASPYMAQELFTKLVNAPYRRLEELSEGTHWIAFEKNRMHLIGEVQKFLEEDRH